MSSDTGFDIKKFNSDFEIYKSEHPYTEKSYTVENEEIISNFPLHKPLSHIYMNMIIHGYAYKMPMMQDYHLFYLGFLLFHIVMILMIISTLFT